MLEMFEMLNVFLDGLFMMGLYLVYFSTIFRYDTNFLNDTDKSFRLSICSPEMISNSEWK